MEEIRELIQKELNKLDFDCGIPIPDGMVTQTYFGYELQENYTSSDLNGFYEMEISLTGRLVRRNNIEEDSLKLLYDDLEKLKQVLKSLNFKYSYNDINFDDNYRKAFVKANAFYYESNKELIR